MKGNMEVNIQVNDHAPATAARDVHSGEEYLGDFDASSTRTRWSFDFESRDSASPISFL